MRDAVLANDGQSVVKPAPPEPRRLDWLQPTHLGAIGIALLILAGMLYLLLGSGPSLD
jgi:hypothetical protein